MFFNIAKYSVKNILRNKFLTISTILVLTLLMFFINVLWILDSVSLKIISEINSKMSISLYLKEWISRESLEVITLRNNIKNVDEKINFDYKTKEQNLLEMKQKDPELVKILENDNPLPETIILSNIKIEDYESVNRSIENQLSIFTNNEIDKDYFANYTTQYKRINQVTFILNTLKLWLEIVILIFFISIAIITYSVIWNFIYYYKNEIYITRLVWWSKSFIYGPFIMQWIIYSIFSFFVNLLIFLLLLKNLNIAFWEYFQFEISKNLTFLQLIIFIFIGWISWYLSSRKYLKELK